MEDYGERFGRVICGAGAHIVIEPNTGLITSEELTKAFGPENSDAWARRGCSPRPPRQSGRT